MKNVLKEKFKNHVLVKPLYKRLKTGNKIKPQIHISVDSVQLDGHDIKVKRNIIRHKEVFNSKHTLKRKNIFFCDTCASFDKSDSLKKFRTASFVIDGLKGRKMLDSVTNRGANDEIDIEEKKNKLVQAGDTVNSLPKVPCTWLRLYPVPELPDESICSLILRCAFCQFGLSTFLVLWTTILVFIIHYYEGPFEMKVYQNFGIKQNQLMFDLATELRQVGNIIRDVGDIWPAKNHIYRRDGYSGRSVIRLGVIWSALNLVHKKTSEKLYKKFLYKYSFLFVKILKKHCFGRLLMKKFQGINILNIVTFYTYFTEVYLVPYIDDRGRPQEEKISPLSNRWKAAIDKRMEEVSYITSEAVLRGARVKPGRYWSLPGTFLFTIYVMTTLGFGAPVPQSTWGRTATLIYGIFAIPVHFYLMMNASMCIVVHVQDYAGQLRSRLCDKKPSVAGKLSLDNESPNCSRHSEVLNSPSRCFLARNIMRCLSVLSACHCVPLAGVLYYLTGACIFGTLQTLGPLEVLMFPLEFTTAGRLEHIPGHVRILYGFYVEGAMILIACALTSFRRYSTSAFVWASKKYRLFTTEN